MTDHRQYVCGCHVVICTESNKRCDDQRGCEYAIKDPIKDRCWYVNSDGICRRDQMEHEGA